MKIGIVTSGGGAKGSYQFGVLKQLLNSGIKPDVIYGTSVGALNAAGIAYQGVDGLEKIWRGLRGRSDILSLNWYSILWAKGVYSMDPLSDMLDQYVVGTPQCEAVTCSVSLTTGSIRYVSNQTSTLDDFRQSVLDSATIPFIMAPQTEYVDGGCREQTPLRKAIEDSQVDQLYAILCNPWTDTPEPWTMASGFLSSVYIGYRAVNSLLEHQIFTSDIINALLKNNEPGQKKIDIVVYAPKVEPMDTLDFDPDKIAAAIQIGESDTPIQINV